MSGRRIFCGAIASAFLLCCAPLFAAIHLTQVVAGLSSPLFVGHAGDGTNRLFIEEQGGVVKVLQPGATTPTVFLDIHTKVLASGERGLLGLAFHPAYETNRRFFVFYTRTPDGAVVIAEYKASANNPNVADPGEIVLLTIDHSANDNHNGGMLAFGTDGYLYIGVGDGGSANDPPNNAQNTGQLLGKILRIDVDHASGNSPYASPADNPFVSGPGRDEIYSYGWRNPWRFSFDRQTGRQWVADVGQGQREEVDTPVVKGGNYGWRVWEGFRCTNNDSALCANPQNYIFPIFDYTHVNARCSITGGYVYRGAQGTVPFGTYIYGDYCSGEIFTWDGATQMLALDTSLNISSFGEDESGELYVVGLGGVVSRIESDSPCGYGITPAETTVPAAGGSGSVAVTAADTCGWTAASNASWIQVTSPVSGSGNGNGTVTYDVDASSIGSVRVGTVAIATKTFTVTQTGCTFTITPTSTTVAAAGGTGTVNVTATAGCSWTAVSDVSWMRVTSGASGTGDGVVGYVLDPYTGRPRNRNGTLTIAGKTFSVRQSR